MLEKIRQRLIYFKLKLQLLLCMLFEANTIFIALLVVVTFGGGGGGGGYVATDVKSRS